jgi:galactose mutarotase-like enzyme
MTLERLTAQSGNVWLEVVPERGCLVTALRVDGKDVLWLDPSTVDDLGKSVRGGIPLLFPFAGRLASDTFEDAGTVMKQHGFGRTLPWPLTERRPGVLRFTLHSSPGTHGVYPFDFTVDHTLTLLPRGLLAELTIHNRSEVAMPISPGWHPYFPCPNLRKQHVKTDVPGLDPARFDPALEYDFGVPPAAHGRAVCDVPGLGTLRITHSPEMRHFQCWSLPGRDFICLEPFLGPNNNLNTPSRLVLPPNTARTLFMRLELDT